jgi:hypothetical protein
VEEVEDDWDLVCGQVYIGKTLVATPLHLHFLHQTKKNPTQRYAGGV